MKAKPVYNKITKKWNIKIYYLQRPCNIFVPKLNKQGEIEFTTEELAQNFINNKLKDFWSKLK